MPFSFHIDKSKAIRIVIAKINKHKRDRTRKTLKKYLQIDPKKISLPLTGKKIIASTFFFVLSHANFLIFFLCTWKCFQRNFFLFSGCLTLKGDLSCFNDLFTCELIYLDISVRHFCIRFALFWLIFLWMLNWHKRMWVKNLKIYVKNKKYPKL